jgi:hypothetical protein
MRYVSSLRYLIRRHLTRLSRLIRARWRLFALQLLLLLYVFLLQLLRLLLVRLLDLLLSRFVRILLRQPLVALQLLRQGHLEALGTPCQEIQSSEFAASDVPLAVLY